MTYNITVRLRNPEDGAEEAFAIEGVTDERGLHAAVDEAVPQAAKRFASRHIDYDSFQGDSAYLDAIDKIAGAMEINSLGKTLPVGQELRRYLVDGTYSDDSGDWSDWVWAVDHEDARLQAAFQMALNEGLSSKVADYDDLSGVMEQEGINHVEEDPVTKSEMEVLIRTLVQAGQAVFGDKNTHLSTTVADALKAAVKTGEDALQAIDAARPAQARSHPEPDPDPAAMEMGL